MTAHRKMMERNTNRLQRKIMMQYDDQFTVYMEQVLDDLKTTTLRLQSNDPSLIDFSPWKRASQIPFSFHLLELDCIQVALRNALLACHNSDHVRSVTLHGLPEPDLSAALYQLSRSNHRVPLEQFVVHELSPSQSISLSSLLKLLPTLSPHTLKCLHVDTRMRVSSQQELDDLAHELQKLEKLEELSLKLMLKCVSLESPSLYMDSVLYACAGMRRGRRIRRKYKKQGHRYHCSQVVMPSLKELSLSLGYDHNPFGKPLLKSVDPLVQLLAVRNNNTITNGLSSRLQHLTLRNFGFGDEHIFAISNCLRQNGCSLQSLILGSHARVTQDGLHALIDALKHDNYTITNIQVSVATNDSIDGDGVDIQRELKLYGCLNSLGRREWMETVQKHECPSLEEWITKLQEAAEEESLDVTYWMVRTYPFLLLL